ncbi:helix-turn-helix domain-containing protein [Pulveribacter suum]|uniref:XRE family transcriptional regulator n=1 Tax=Pulveribacter suum TaxID=2116657 RepID=A0A2P1NHT1_9BURK|nr:helix-turn-helix transcriptional regulator [Pulveribacter suum]AVP56540.1 XRE family transcriptional regulator [Pulveribacter suum]
MQLSLLNLESFAVRLQAERKGQGLSRSQAAAVCNVSTSFIRDAESAPERCSLGKLLLLMQGLGLSLAVENWSQGGQEPNPAPAQFGTPSVVLGPPPEDSAP